MVMWGDAHEIGREIGIASPAEPQPQGWGTDGLLVDLFHKLALQRGEMIRLLIGGVLGAMG